MFYKSALASAAAALMLAGSVQAAPASSGNLDTIAVINVPLIMHDIPQAKTVQESLQKEFASRIKEIQDLEKKGQKLTADVQGGKLTGDKLKDAQRELALLQSDYNLKGRALQEDMARRNQEEQSKLAVSVQKAIDDIAKERGLQLVLRGESIVYTVSALDISQDVIKRVGANAKKK